MEPGDEYRQRATHPCHSSFIRKVLLSFSLLAAGTAATVSPARAQQCTSTPVDVGYRTVNYTGLTGHPTESKPESKLWYNDGYWWGVLWDPNQKDHRIHRFDDANQCWISVGPMVDTRTQSAADALWDEANQKLYISSRAKETNKTSDKKTYLKRYSYDSTTQTYSLDSGFPAVIQNDEVEALTIAKDSSGQLWAAWEISQKIYINRTVGSDNNWGTPFVLPVLGNNVTADDICAITAFDGNKIGVMWSNQNDKKMYFAVHLDSKGDTDWEPREDALADPNLGGVADDHINIALACSQNSGTLVAATKTSLSGNDAPLIYLLKRDPSGVWSSHVFGLGKQKHTRPIVLVNSENDSVYVIAKAKTTPIKIFMKRTHLDNPSFAPGYGEEFIVSSTDGNMNDPTSTKQCVNSKTNLLVLVSDKSTKYYLHNYLDLTGNVPLVDSFSPTSGPVGTEVTVSGSRFTGATGVAFNGIAAATFTVDSDTQIRATVPAGASTGKISVTNAAGAGQSTSDFTVIKVPVVSSFSPTDGPVGTEVTVTGSEFLEITDVTFNGTSTASFTLDSSTQIRATVPTGATTGPIGVTNAAGTGSSSTDFVVTSVPNIASFTPTSGPVATEVTLSGLNFTGTTSVAFGGVAATAFTVDSDSQLRAIVPSGATTGLIAVTNADGTGTSATSFTVVYPPTVTAFSPTTGYEGLEITITGTNFVEVTDVTFNGFSAASFVVDADTSLRAVVPTGATTGPVGVTNLAGSASSAGNLTIIPAPTIHTFNPTDDARVWSANPQNNYGSSIELRVRETSSAEINSYLKFNVTALGGTVNKATLRLKVNDGSVEGGSVYLVSNDYLGTTTPWTEGGLIWDNAPAITGTPIFSLGAVTTGDTVEFDVTSAITADGVYSFVISNNTSDVVKYSSKEGAFAPELVVEVFKDDIPTVSAFSPTSGGVGTEVTISGTNFSSATDVQFNGTSASSFTIDSSTQIRATVPTGATTGRISVSNSKGTGSSATDFVVLQPPTLTSFSPTSGEVGTEVTLSGSDFSGTTDVAFNGLSASFTVDSDTQIRATVPSGATTGPLSVTNAAGTATSSSDFTVLYPPAVSSFSPTSGPVGTEVTVTGSKFTGTTGVAFNGTAATTFSVDSDTQIRANVPVGATTGKISVTNADGTGQSTADFVVILPPTIASFSPTSGAEGTEVTVTGTNFATLSDVIFNGAAASSFTADSDTLVRAVVPSGAGTGPIVVTNPAGSDTSTSDFTVLYPPVVSAFSPTNGPAGTEVTVTGAHFTGTTNVAFNGTAAATFVVDSDSLLRATVPAGATTGPISVTNSDGTTASGSDFTVILPPTLTSFTPTSGEVGSEVTLSGANFSGATDVAFNGTSSGSFTVDSDTQIRANVPTGATTGPIRVSNVAGADTSADNFTVLYPPQVTAFTPASGPVGTEVTVTGVNFSGATGVAFNGTAATTFTVDSDTELRATVPGGATTGPITVTNADGSGSSSSDFTVVLPPTVTSFSPDTGPPGTEVTITGSDFTGATDVTFNGSSASSFTVDSDTQVRAAVPFGATTGPISVTNAAGTGTSLADFTVTDPPSTFTFNPTHDSFVRSNKPTNNYGSLAEMRVRETSSANLYTFLKFDVSGLSGTVQKATLKLSVIDASNEGGAIYSVSNYYAGTTDPWTESGLIWDNAPAISGTPLSTLGAVSLGQIVEFDVTAAISGDGTYSFGIENNTSDVLKYSSKEGSVVPELVVEVLTSPLPNITSFTPASGPVGTEVTLTGANFTGTTDVSFNGTAALVFTVISDSEIRATVPSGATTGPISVTNADGTGTSPSDFTVLQPPVVTSFSPTSGEVGIEVTVSGSNFSGATDVAFNGTSAANFVLDSDTQIRATVPTGASTGPISVTNSAGTGGSTGDFTVLLPPQVSSFDPTSGPVGTEVTLTGLNFTGATDVSFNGTPASFTIDSDTQIRATVPASATTGPISVTNADGTGLSASDFTVVQPPGITGFSPGDGPPGTEVTITGTNFSGTSDVAFNGTSSGSFVVDSDTQIRAVVPTGATTGPISVTNAAGVGTSGSDFLVTDPPSSFTFNPTDDTFGNSSSPNKVYGSALELRVRQTSSATVISFLKFSVTGLSGAVQSARLRLTVNDASNDGGDVYAVSNFYAGTSDPWTESGLTWNNAPTVSGTPLSSAGAVSVGQVVEFDVTGAITGDGVYSFAIKNASTDACRYDPKEGTAIPELVVDVLTSPVPNITSFSPTSGSPGTEVTVSGSNFTGSVDVAFNGSSASFVVDSDSQIRATVPAGATTGPISVTNADGTGSSGSDFTVLVPPTVSSFSPTSGEVGSEVTVSGSNFTGATDVTFNGVSASAFVVDSDTQIRATVPGSATNGPIGVTTPGGTGSSSSSFTVLHPPHITGFSPDTGPVGTEVTITGEHFSGAADVAFNGTSATFSIDSDTQLRATVPAGATTGPISVTNADGTGAGTSDFTVVQLPTVSSFSPTSGPEGSEVTVTGTNFSGATDVAFNGTSAAGFTVDSDTQLRATVPTGATTGPISVTNAAGTGVSSGDFTVTFVPSISSFTPTSGVAGTEVTVTGVNFTGTTDVSFNGTAASTFTVDSDTQIRAAVPTGATTGPISVTNADGTGSSGDDFVVVQPPTVSSFSPTEGPPGTEVTVTGTDFVSVTDVAFNGLSAGSFTVDSDTQLRAVVPSGASTGPISVTNGAGSGASTTDFTVTSPPSSFTFNPTDDAFVRSARASKNYGAALELRVRKTSSASVHAYLKFNVTGLSGTVTSARIRLTVMDASNDGGSIYSVSNNYEGTTDPWVELGLKWNNAPVISGTPLSTVGSVSLGQVVEFDVTAAITGDGVYSFAIANNSSDVCKYESKESTNAPELVIEVSSPSTSAKVSDLVETPVLTPEVESQTEEAVLPKAVSLLPNYPNPFNIETTIEYTLPREARVRLFIYNLRGQEVRKLVDGVQAPGFKKVRWDGRNQSNLEVSSGLYVVRLKVGGKVFSRKITLQK